MKKILPILALLLLCTACTSPQQEIQPTASPAAPSIPLIQLSAAALEPVQDGWEAIFVSYYAAQEEPVFEYIQKNRIRRFMTEHWTPATLTGIRNQQWHLDSFAEYVILNESGTVLSDDLYYCTFSADNDQHGFIVVKYFAEYPAVQNQGVVLTNYLYDLQALAERISKAMDEAGVDLSAVTAVRGRLGSDEMILFTVSGGGRYACNLASFEVVSLSIKK